MSDWADCKPFPSVCPASWSGITGLIQACTGLLRQGVAREASLSLNSSNSVLLSAENYTFKYK